MGGGGKGRKITVARNSTFKDRQGEPHSLLTPAPGVGNQSSADYKTLREAVTQRVVGLAQASLSLKPHSRAAV